MLANVGIGASSRHLVRRLTVARATLILGWVVVVASLPMGIAADDVWGKITVYSTWAEITSPYLMFFTIPFFLGLAGATLAGLMPTRSTHSRLLWACRITTVGLLCEVLADGALILITHLYQPRVDTTNLDRAIGASIGGGFGGLLLVIGSLLIGLSAWIRPVRASSESENGK